MECGVGLFDMGLKLGEFDGSRVVDAMVGAIDGAKLDFAVGQNVGL